MADETRQSVSSPAWLNATVLRVCLLVGVVFLGGCPGDDDEEAISAVEIRPEVVVIRAQDLGGNGQAQVPKFRLHARLIDEAGRVLPDVERDDKGYVLPDPDQYLLDWDWVADPPGGYVPTGGLSPAGRYVNVSIAPVPLNMLPLTLMLRVEVHDAGIQGFGTIEIYASTMPPGFEVREPSPGFELPVIGAVDYAAGQPGTAIGYQFGAFVDGAPFPTTGGANSPPTRATAFRMRAIADIRDVASNLGNQPSLPTASLAPEPRTLNAHVWLAVSDDGLIQEQVKHELRLADSILVRNRVGIRVAEPPIDFLPPVHVGVADVSTACDRDTLATPGFFDTDFTGVGPDFTDETLLNIVYVESFSTARGFTCDHMYNLGGLIMIDAGNHKPVDLGHELGHALGLQDPNGHVEGWPEFEPVWRLNMMTDETGVWQRSLDQLTIGQAWWMNLTVDSWINIQPAPTPPPDLISCWLASCPELGTGVDDLQ